MLKRTISLAVLLLTVWYANQWLVYVGSWSEPRVEGAVLDWTRTISLSLLGLLAFAASVLALRKPKIAALLLFVTGAVIALGIAITLGTPRTFVEEPTTYQGLRRPIAMYALSLFLIPGLFWMITARWLEWPPILKSPLQVWKAGVLSAVFILLVLGSLVVRELGLPVYSCHWIPQPSAEQRDSEQAIFTASVLGTGILWPRGDAPLNGYPRRYWAIAVVRDHYWGLSWWDKKIVLLTGFSQGVPNRFESNHQYFVEGWRRPGAFVSLLPIFETFCSRTRRLAAAEVDLRVLRDGKPRRGARVLGRVVRTTAQQETPVAGAPIEVVTFGKKYVATTDEHGFYDFTGIQPGDYAVFRRDAEVPPEMKNRPACRLRAREGDVHDCTIVMR
jgi:hypothetical protein